MTDFITLEGLSRAYDGRYELDLGNGLTSREWGWVKRLAGYLPMQVDGDVLGDPEFICVLAAIAIRRAGKVEAPEVPHVYERLLDAPAEAILRFESDEEEEPEGDAGPPAENSNGNTPIFGDDLKPSSASSEPTRSPIGTRGLGSSEFDPATSES